MSINSESHHNNTSKKFVEELISSYYDSNPKEKRNSFEIRPKCDYCKVMDAKWENFILKEYCCNDCVPRGCSCRLFKIKKRNGFSIDNYSYKTDQYGDELPCEDWHIF